VDAGSSWRTLRIHEVRAQARDVLSIDLRSADGSPLAPFTAGAHIDVQLAVGRDLLTRAYSLCNDPAETHRYVIGVARDAASRGGSAAVHERLRANDSLRVRGPRNLFALDETAEHSVLVAGGIGITPLLSMARRLTALKRSWTLYLCARTPSRAAFVDDLLELQAASEGRGRLELVFDRLPGAASLDLAAVLGAVPPQTHVYGCGPEPLLQAFLAAAAHLPAAQVHVERFTASTAELPPVASGGFVVHLKRAGRSITVLDGVSVLDALLDADVEVDHSCRQGVCGTCETRVLEGMPLHLDPILPGRQPVPLDTMMVCVSRCAGDHLVLDL
jgi:tetrachlorobenzoquinone reductase